MNLFEKKWKLLYKNLNDCLDIQLADNSSLIKSPQVIIQELFKLFEIILCDNNTYYFIQDFLNLLQENEYLANLFQLSIYLVKNDKELDLILTNMNRTSNKKFSFNLIKKLFLILLRKLSNKQLISYLDDFLKKRNLILNYIDCKREAKKHIYFNDNEDTDQQDDDTGFDNIEEDDQNETDQSIRTFNNDFQKVNCISRQDLILKINENLTNTNQNPTQLIQNLSQIEDNVLSHFNGDKFNDLNEDDLPFLKFITKNNIKLDIQQSTGNFTFKRFLFENLKQIINSHELNLSSSRNILELLICSNYGLSNITQFGYLNFDSFLNDFSKYDEFQFEFNFYQNSILDLPNATDTLEFDEIIEQLSKCPLLDNLYEFTNWVNLSLSKYGNLKEFLLRLPDDKRIYTLEINPFCLLKLTSKCNLDELNRAILSLDYIESSGQLVSLIAIKYKALRNSPLNLISKQMLNSFEQLYEQLRVKIEFYKFIVKFITRLPVFFASNILLKLLLEPLIKIEGSIEFVKEQLYKVAFENDYNRVYFNKLGNLCNIPEWTIEFKICSVTPNNAIHDQLEVKPLKVEKKVESIECVQTSATNSVSPILPTNCNDHIEQIRRDKYGIGVEINSQNEKMFSALKKEISSCLLTLSNELYNKDMHFVLELIQNADDNLYQLSENEPFIQFIIENNSITLLNNEVGFSPKNIEAICAIGASTKGKHQHGYIGRKGIGFKSVFTVTNSPFIKSNGYSIKFDITNNSFGYIVPIWLNSDESLHLDDLVRSYTNSKSNITCIHLPLKSLTERERHKSHSLTKSFNDIQSSLLLFLNRLKSIRLFNNVYNTKSIYQRNDINENLIEIDETIENSNENVTKTNKKWLINRKTLIVPEKIDKPNESIKSTDLCLAFPLYNHDYEILPKLDVYAYLPLRSFNFKFIIQADFQVPASRQDLMHNSEWNEWLVEEIPQLFVDSINLFIQNYKSTNIVNGIKYFLKFIPNTNEISGFFHHIPSTIFALLRNQSFIPILEIQSLKKPIECVILSTDDTDGLLTTTLIKEYLQKYYVNPSLFENNKNLIKLLLNMGVRQLSVLDVISIMEVLYSQSNSYQNYHKIEDSNITKWILLLKRMMLKSFHLNDEDNVKFLIKQLYIILLSNNKNNLTCLGAHKNIYFQIQSKNSNELFNDDLNFIDINAYPIENSKQQAELIEFFEYLNIKPIDSKQVIRDYIIIEFENYSFSISNPKKLINMVLYIFNYFMLCKKEVDIIDEDEKEIINKLKKNIVFMTDDDQFKNSNVYLSEIYQNKFNLKKLFPHYNKFNLISQVYLNESLRIVKKSITKEQLIIKWRKFFGYFGINDLFSLQECSSIIDSNKDSKEFIHQIYQIDLSSNNDEHVTIIDYKCELLEFYVEKLNDFNRLEFEENEIDEDFQRFLSVFQTLFDIFQKNWSKNIDFQTKLQDYKFVKLSIINPSNHESRNEIICTKKATKFYKCLLDSSWCVGKINSYSLNSVNLCLSKKIKLCRPSEIYLNKEAINRYYGYHNVPYLNSNSDDLEFFNDICIRHKFIFNEFIEYLKQLLSQLVEYFASFDQIYHIYQLISYQNDTHDNNLLIDLVKNYPILFVPRKNLHLNEIFYGQWISLNGFNKIYIKDNNNLFTKYSQLNNFIFLESLYQNNEKILNLVSNMLKISKYPSIDDYIGLLELISTNCLIEKLDFNDSLPDIYCIFEILANFNIDSQLLKAKLINKAVLPCIQNKFRSLDDNIFISDNYNLAKQLIEKMNLLVLYKNDTQNYLKLSNLNNILLEFFHQKCGIKLLSQVLDCKFNLERTNQSTNSLKEKLNKLLPLIQSYLFCKNEFKSIYKSLKYDDNIVENLKNLEIISCKRLKIIYNYKYDSQVQLEIDTRSYFAKNSSQNWNLFIQDEYSNSEKEIVKAFAKIFTQNETQEKELVNYIANIFDYSKAEITENDKKEIENDMDIKLDLPKSEELWILNKELKEQLNSNFMSTPRASISHQMSTIYEGPPQETPRIDFDRFLNVNTPTPKYSSRFEYSRDILTYNTNEIEEVSFNETHTKFSPHTLNELQLLKLNTINEQSDYRNKIGRWGEKFVYEMLVKKYENEIRKSLVKIEWINRENESGHPYDIKVINYDEENYWDTKSEVFIEVKSTTRAYSTTNKDYFPVSINELTFALSKPNNFEIYRLFNACSDNLNQVKIKKIKNIQKNLSTHAINLLMIA